MRCLWVHSHTCQDHRTGPSNTHGDPTEGRFPIRDQGLYNDRFCSSTDSSKAYPKSSCHARYFILPAGMQGNATINTILMEFQNTNGIGWISHLLITFIIISDGQKQG